MIREQRIASPRTLWLLAPVALVSFGLVLTASPTAPFASSPSGATMGGCQRWRFRTLSEAGPPARPPQVAADPGGGAVVVWDRYVSRYPQVEATRLGAKRSGAVHTLSAPGRKGLANACCPSLVVDRSDRATLAWVRYDGKRDRIETARSRPG